MAAFLNMYKWMYIEHTLDCEGLTLIHLAVMARQGALSVSVILIQYGF